MTHFRSNTCPRLAHDCVRNVFAGYGRKNRSAGCARNSPAGRVQCMGMASSMHGGFNRCPRPHVVFSTQASKSSGAARSEEHKSELQSLMRISYDFFCLKKKT